MILSTAWSFDYNDYLVIDNKLEQKLTIARKDVFLRDRVKHGTIRPKTGMKDII